MAILLQIDFPNSGPFGDQMAQAYADLAASMSAEPRPLWKIWTENADAQTAGGIYLFADQPAVYAYADIHSKRLESFGMTGIRAEFFDVNETLLAVSRGPMT